MAKGVLYTPDNYYRGMRVLIAAKMSDYSIEVKPWDSSVTENQFLHFKEPSTGVTFFEVNAIVNYISTEKFKGGELQNVALEWANWVDTQVCPAMAAWVYPILGVMEAKPEQAKLAKNHIKQFLKMLDGLLKNQTFIINDDITQADVATACILMLLFQHALDAKARANYPSVMRWFNTIVNQEAFLSVNGGELKLCEKEKESKPKQVKSSKPDNVKQKKPSKKATPDEDEDEEVAAPPAKSVFASFPPGRFNMKEWKVCYSNNDFETVSWPYFLENFDPDNYSVWFSEYMYADELRLSFMTSNLVGGMFQRLDKLNSYAFAAVCIFGVDNDYQIRGVWIWRGHELAFTLDADLSVDYESYKWEKLDYAKDETKMLMKQYFNQEFDESMRLKSAKIFK